MLKGKKAVRIFERVRARTGKSVLRRGGQRTLEQVGSDALDAGIGAVGA